MQSSPKDAQLAKVRELTRLTNELLESQKEVAPLLSKDANEMIRLSARSVSKTLGAFVTQKQKKTATSKEEDSEFESPSQSEAGSDREQSDNYEMGLAKLDNTQKYPCGLCRPVKFQSKHSRHLRLVHSDDKEVSKILAVENSELRSLLFKKMLLDMNYQFHIDNGLNPADSDPTKTVQVYTKRDGSTVTMERTICHRCKRGMAKKHLMPHLKNYCNSVKIDQLREKLDMVVDDSEDDRRDDGSEGDRRDDGSEGDSDGMEDDKGARAKESQQEEYQTPKRAHQSLGKLALMGDSYTPKLRELLASIQGDNIVEVVKKDEVLMEYVSYQAEQYARSRTLQTGRQNIRLLVNFLLHCRVHSESIWSASHLLDPTKYKEISSCLESFAGVDEQGGLKHPSKGKRTGELLSELSKSGIDHAILTKDYQLREDILRWQDLHKRRHFLVSKTARETLKLRTLNTRNFFPFFEDIQKLNDYLNKRMESWKYEKTETAYVSICVAVLSKIILFNRKRQGEASKIMLADFERSLVMNRDESDPHVIASMDRQSQFLTKKMFYLEFVTKGGGRGAVLLTNLMLEKVKQIVQLRRFVVKSHNPYLFARPGLCATHLIGHKALTEEAEASGVARPHLFKSTNLRKHMATLAQSCDLADKDRSLLVAYMNHTGLVHSTYYEKRLSDVAKGTVAQILYRINTGEFDGRTIRDTDIRDDFQLQLDEGLTKISRRLQIVC